MAAAARVAQQFIAARVLTKCGAPRGAAAAAAAALPNFYVTSCRRAASTGGGIAAADAARPDYYRVLGLQKDATADEVKAAFRALAKRHHPDVLASSAPGSGAGDLELFKLVNEAHSVLCDPALRRDYDAEKFSRATLLRRRNEGVRGPSSGAPAPGAIVQFTRSGAAGSSLTAEELAKLSPDAAFRASVARAQERARDTARFRGTLARANRAKVRARSRVCLFLRVAIFPTLFFLTTPPLQVDVLTESESFLSVATPYLVAIGIWGSAFLLFR